MNLIIVPAPHHSDLHEKGVIVDVIEIDLNLSGFDELVVPCVEGCVLRESVRDEIQLPVFVQVDEEHLEGVGGFVG